MNWELKETNVNLKAQEKGKIMKHLAFVDIPGILF